MHDLQHIYLAGGCFWGTEHFFKQIAGVVETEVGFANGQTEYPTYEQVYTDTTGYAETVHVKYDPDKVSLEFLLRMFFVAIDPTSLNKQGHDEGTRYRTGIYYTDEADLPVIDKIYAEEQSKYAQPLVVEILPLQNFYPADEYHQDYLDKHPDGYCHLPKALFAFARQTWSNKVLRITPEYITSLKPNEIFVFGSNLAGMHGGGAARMAHKLFGAEMGVGVGRTGQCYAIPTMQGGIETIRPYVDEFIAYAKQHPELLFRVTRIGCGIAGFTNEEIAPLFKAACEMENVSLPNGWREINQ